MIQEEMPELVGRRVSLSTQRQIGVDQDAGSVVTPGNIRSTDPPKRPKEHVTRDRRENAKDVHTC
jgi:hypothetical protein